MPRSRRFRIQYGVLPFLYLEGELRVVLVTSRTSGNWIFPKGGRVPGKSRVASALQEAREEAGLIGRRSGRIKFRDIVDHPEGRIDLTLYPMQVERLLPRWPEAHQRQRAVVSVAEASELLTFSASKRMLRAWARKHRKPAEIKGELYP